MDILRRFIVMLFGLAIGTATTILVLIKGWGLEPKSYWWIIGVSIFGHIFAQLIIELGKDNPKKK